MNDHVAGQVTEEGGQQSDSVSKALKHDLPMSPPVFPPMATVAMAAAREVSLATLAAAHEATMAPKEKHPLAIKNVAPY